MAGIWSTWQHRQHVVQRSSRTDFGTQPVTSGDRRRRYRLLEIAALEILGSSQATVSRYMPRRGYPPAQRWRTFLRNQAFAIGATGFGEAGRLSDFVRGWIMRVGRCATKVRDGIPRRFIEPSSTLHPLWKYRSSNRADRRVAQRRCVPGSSAVHPSKRRPLDLASRRLSPYRSRASPRRKLPSIRELHTIIRYRAQSQADHNSFTGIALRVCHQQSETLQKLAPKSKDLQKPVATWRSPCDSATADKVMRNDSGRLNDQVSPWTPVAVTRECRGGKRDHSGDGRRRREAIYQKPNNQSPAFGTQSLSVLAARNGDRTAESSVVRRYELISRWPRALDRCEL
jgi:hypothetical protein